MYFVDIDFSKTDNDIFAYCPHSSLKQGNKEQNSVMIEMHIVLMTEYVCISCKVKHWMQKKKIDKIKNAVIFNQKG